ncbi:MAG: SulP family inorganic anion transporter [Acidimicrobiales bacterium]|nr:SulP family inorganic anion transporter [Acidimicrobiales bacterium]
MAREPGPIARWRRGRSPGALRDDAVAGVVVGVQSVPDGLATGLLAGVNPLAGLNAYLVGTASGALFTSSTFMAVQGTGAMAILIADVPAITESAEPTRALVTLSVLTGIVMLTAGILRLGSVLRFVSNAVMVGFINAVGVNIVLGQLANLTGYSADGAGRLARAFNTLISPGELQWASVAVGVGTITLILLLERTRLGAIGLVVAVIATSAVTAWLGWDSVATLRDLGVVADALPRPEWPLVRLVPVLIIPALSLAFVGLVQGAGVSANFPNPDGTYPDASRDFVGQGAANVASGLLQGMPVGGSVSASALNKEAGARSRISLIVASAVMALVIVVFGDAVGSIAMPSLAGLLILIGYRTIKPADLASVWRTGSLQKIVLATTFLLTMVIPLQYAVLVGVALSAALHVVRQSNQVTVRRRVLDPDGDFVEVDPPAELGADDVVVLQPYGSIFFAAAPVFETALPSVVSTSTNSVVILRLRGRSDLGTTFMDVLLRYGRSLAEVGSRLMIVSADERIIEQLEVTGITSLIGADSIYPGDERVGATVKRAHADAVAWVERHR